MGFLLQQETMYEVIYQNRIIHNRNSSRLLTTPYSWYTTPYYWFTTQAPIARYDGPDIEVQCRLDNYINSVGHYRPINNHSVYASGRGNFSVSMNFYYDSAYQHRIRSYPLSIGLNEDVFVDLELNTLDHQLKIFPWRCYATPNDYRYTSQQHKLIDNG